MSDLSDLSLNLSDILDLCDLSLDFSFKTCTICKLLPSSPSCPQLQMCRAIIRDEYGQPLVYDSVPGQLDVTFDQDIANPIKVGKILLGAVLNIHLHNSPNYV